MAAKYKQQTVYVNGNKLYLNITNMCNCSCDFCISKFTDSMYGTNLKYHQKEPSASEIIDILKSISLEDYLEVVFCGFGEPLLRFDTLLEVVKYIKEADNSVPIRINTNGLADLANEVDTMTILSSYIDSVSVSLNAQTPEVYKLYVKPKYDFRHAYTTVLKTIKKSVELGLNTRATVVYGSNFDKIDLNKCEQIATDLGATFKVRYS